MTELETISDGQKSFLNSQFFSEHQSVWLTELLPQVRFKI